MRAARRAHHGREAACAARRMACPAWSRCGAGPRAARCCSTPVRRIRLRAQRDASRRRSRRGRGHRAVARPLGPRWRDVARAHDDPRPQRRRAGAVVRAIPACSKRAASAADRLDTADGRRAEHLRTSPRSARDVVLTREPQYPLDGLFYVSGEIHAHTPFERGYPGQVRRTARRQGMGAGRTPDRRALARRERRRQGARRAFGLLACRHRQCLQARARAVSRYPDPRRDGRLASFRARTRQSSSRPSRRCGSSI